MRVTTFALKKFAVCFLSQTGRDFLGIRGNVIEMHENADEFKA
jgi:hypothetical protein